MRVKVELEKDETPEQADEFLAKALKTKQECSGGERYADDWLNELEGYVCAEHQKVLDELATEISALVVEHADR